MATIGVVGGGQLGRMLCTEAQAAGHRVIVRTDEPAGGPAGQVADGECLGPYDHVVANAQFAAQCDAVTVEFENLPGALLRDLASVVPMRPGAASVEICQHRRREKEFLRRLGFPHARFEVVRSAGELAQAVNGLGGTAIAKTAAFGYDGKGQVRFRPGDDVPGGGSSACDVEAAWADLAAPEVVVEQLVAFRLELSVVGVRGVDGTWVPFAPGENVHVGGVLDHTVVPAGVPAATAAAAQRVAGEIAAALDHVGVIGVEFFVLDDWSLVVNEMAPRPHNSGHHTIDACVTSQFGQQWRAALGVALGDPSPTSQAVAMCNLLGDLWVGGEPRWEVLADQPGVHLHLYGKSDPKPGRKLGHLTVVGSTADEARSRVLTLRHLLVTGRCEQQ